MCYNIEYVPYINALLGCPAAVCAYPLSAQTMAIPMILFSSVIRRSCWHANESISRPGESGRKFH